MKHLIKLLIILAMPLWAQQLTYRLPRDANNAVLYSGVGNPYAFTLTPTTASYSISVRYQIPSTGVDTNRVYRHLYVLNRSATRTAYVCFGDDSGCSVDSFIVRPGYGLVFEPLRFGKAVDLEYVYARLDAAGTQELDFAVW
jgi:hypothetical protein